MILYLHGFRSSPVSLKARLVANYLQQAGRTSEFVCPQLPASPKLAIKLATQLILSCRDKLAIIGSSLGGYYATYLAEQFSCRAALLNPAVKAPSNLDSYVGVTTQYHSDEPFEFKREYIDELALFKIDKITQPKRYFLLAAKGDELLDWRDMVRHYPEAQQHIIQGSDHSISDFENYLDQIMAFCDAK